MNMPAPKCWIGASRNADVKLGDEDFWEAALSAHDWKLSSSGDHPSGDGGVTGVPTFLVPIMHHVVGAGKAAEMLQLLDGLLQSDGLLPSFI